MCASLSIWRYTECQYKILCILTEYILTFSVLRTLLKSSGIILEGGAEWAAREEWGHMFALGFQSKEPSTDLATSPATCGLRKQQQHKQSRGVVSSCFKGLKL